MLSLVAILSLFCFLQTYLKEKKFELKKKMEPPANALKKYQFQKFSNPKYNIHGRVLVKLRPAS